MARGSYTWNEQSSFVNPYNFVSSDFSQKTKADLKKEKHTGVLKCHLITKTPVAIPGEIIEESIEETRVGEKPNQTHKTYEFFNYGEGKYVIPGSSIRGAVRSVYEAITDSCYVTADEEELITKRSNRPYRAGVLIRQGTEWKLYPATRYKFKVNEYAKFQADGIWLENLKKECCFGDKVSFDIYNKKKNYVRNIRKCSEKSKKKNEGYLYLGEYIDGKSCESIFKIGEKTQPIRIDTKAMESAKKNLEETIRLYNNPAVNRNKENEEKNHSGYKDSAVNRNKENKERNHSGYKDYERAEKNGVIPLWYQFDEKRKKLSLSMACLGRVAYQNTMGKLLKEKVPCTERKNLCKACALFGMASSEEAVGTRTRFTDAMIDKENIKLEENGKLPKKTLEELASPKPSYLPFYLKKPDDEKIDDKKKRTPINDYDSSKAELRGRKFYWHSRNIKKSEKETKRNATMEVIENKEKGFQFSVFYDDISETQLKELIWVLTLGENSQDSYRCYKIGHGKPIGLGSVKIVIDEQIERTYQDGYCLKKCKVETVEDIFPDNHTKKELLRIMTMDDSIKNVQYPYVYSKDKNIKDENIKDESNSVAAHRWFGENYKLGKTPPKYYLPEIMENNKLPSLTYTENNSDDNFSGQKGKKK